jgi:methionyl aminopeptidase
VAKLKSQEDFVHMRAAGHLAALTLREAGKQIKPGISTEQINQFVHEYIVSRGAYPSPLNYKGFPKSVCTSVNEVVCHGIPKDTEILKEGDIINVDVTVTLNGYFGDCSQTFIVGSGTTPEREAVVEAARESLARAIAVVRHGSKLGDIGAAIQNYAEGEKGLGVVRDFVGHGIGKVFHEAPQVPHYGVAGTGMKLTRGMCFTIEPMINFKSWRTKLLGDGWTAITSDGQPSAQFEHTIGLSGDGVELFTALEDDWILHRARQLGATIVSLS